MLSSILTTIIHHRDSISTLFDPIPNYQYMQVHFKFVCVCLYFIKEIHQKKCKINLSQ